ncbi:MAG: hypothetical protein Q8L08_10840 [Candidatus Nanopelagicaceae bacterium]|nr:hypothetical protein [Candidatus Nanopelagicaceae bacterium]
MKIKTKTLVLSTVGAFALSYAIVGSNAFADTTAPTPVDPVLTTSTTLGASSTLGASTVSPIQPPAGLTSSSAGITQDDENDDLNDLSDDVNEVGDHEDDEISDDDSITVDISADVNLSSDIGVDLGEDD